jgi:UPF0271 protein
MNARVSDRATGPVSVDLNCDLGEGAGHDVELMPWITSANIACGGHAGDEATMRATVALAERHGVAIGAHPGFADRAQFGRRELNLPLPQIRALVRSQVEALAMFATIRHVKPHGALYNLAARDRSVAEAIAEAVAEFDPTVTLFALAGSESVAAARAKGLRVAEEVFPDRTYQADGQLTSRTQPDALVTTEAATVGQALRIVCEGVVRATDGTDVPVRADTLCVHGDGVRAVAFARALHGALTRAGVKLVGAGERGPR